MGKIDTLSITEGSEVSYRGVRHTIRRILNLRSVLICPLDGSGAIVNANISDLKPASDPETSQNSAKVINIDLVPEEKWKIAQKRFEIIKPAIDSRLSVSELEQLAKANKVHVTTIYRWINRYSDGQQLSSLLPSERDGGKGVSRISQELEAIIQATIEEEYLTKQKKTMQKVCEEVALRCHNAKIAPPSFHTIRRRIEAISNERKVKHRQGSEVARQAFQPLKSKFTEAQNPLHIVQIDHTILDIILVDEINRKPIQRPWITVAFDVFSRMVVGIYVSFDPPGAIGTGMCLANAILSKEMLLEKHGILGEWPCWGIMKTIHADNAKEFRGNNLKRVAEEYGINLEWREVRRPNWGGHIERYLGTLLKEIQTLPGTTFSNPKERKHYDSAGQAALTLKELEKWIITYIVNVYHKRFHAGIKTSPIAKYTEGIFGSAEQHGIGIPQKLLNFQKVKLDFLPYFERSIQDYGVQIDHIYYYDDKLRPYINSLEQNTLRSKVRRRFIFKRDPRDISVIYFYDPELKQYFSIPYRDASHPPITIWEYKEIERMLHDKGKKAIDERAIFEGYLQMRTIEKEAVTLTKKKRRDKKVTKRTHTLQKSVKTEFNEAPTGLTISVLETTSEAITNNNPFDDIDV